MRMTTAYSFSRRETEYLLDIELAPGLLSRLWNSIAATTHDGGEAEIAGNIWRPRHVVKLVQSTEGEPVRFYRGSGTRFMHDHLRAGASYYTVATHYADQNGTFEIGRVMTVQDRMPGTQTLGRVPAVSILYNFRNASDMQLRFFMGGDGRDRHRLGLADNGRRETAASMLYTLGLAVDAIHTRQPVDFMGMRHQFMQDGAYDTGAPYPGLCAPSLKS